MIKRWPGARILNTHPLSRCPSLRVLKGQSLNVLCAQRSRPDRHTLPIPPGQQGRTKNWDLRPEVENSNYSSNSQCLLHVRVVLVWQGRGGGVKKIAIPEFHPTVKSGMYTYLFCLFVCFQSSPAILICSQSLKPLANRVQQGT